MTIRIRPCHERTEIDVADDGMMILRRFAAETEGGEEKLRRKQAVQPLFISGVAEDSTAPGFSFIRDAWGRSIAVKQPFEQVAELWTVARCRWIAHYGKVP